MTARHCSGVNTVWSQGGSTLGVTAAKNNGGSFDAQLITTAGYRNNWGRVHKTFADDAHAVTFGCTSGHDLLNKTVCQTGAKTTCSSGNCNLFARCALVTSLSFRPPSYGDAPYAAAFGWADYLNDHGDSGAAVYWSTGYGFGAAGIHGGGYAGGYGAYFSRFSVIAAAWGLSVSPY